MDIQHILTELNKDMSDADIGEAIGAPQSIVCRLRNGVHKRTFYDRAEKIRTLAISKGVIEPTTPADLAS